MGGQGHGRDLIKSFGDVACAVWTATSLDETLRRVVERAVTTIDGCDSAAVALRRRNGEITPSAASPELAATCEALQCELEEGPCASTPWESGTVASEDLCGEQRWPRWSPRAIQLGAQSLVSFQLFVDDGTLAALTMYSAAVRAFREVDCDHGAVLAAHVGVALMAAERKAHMDRAIVVAKATGMVMERRRVPSDEALDLMRRTARGASLTLHDVADRVVSARRPAP